MSSFVSSTAKTGDFVTHHFSLSQWKIMWNPMTMIAAVTTHSSQAHIHSHPFPKVVMLLLGFSNRSVSSMGMMHAPDLLKSSKEKEEWSTVMTLVLSAGLLIGSAGSFLML